MHWCSKCGKKTAYAGHAYCNPCHQEIVADIKRREALPVGGLSGAWPAKPSTKPDITDPSQKECKELLRWMQLQCKCRGLSAAPKEETDPSWDNGVRALEER